VHFHLLSNEVSAGQATRLTNRQAAAFFFSMYRCSGSRCNVRRNCGSNAGWLSKLSTNGGGLHVPLLITSLDCARSKFQQHGDYHAKKPSHRMISKKCLFPPANGDDHRAPKQATRLVEYIMVVRKSLRSPRLRMLVHLEAVKACVDPNFLSFLSCPRRVMLRRISPLCAKSCFLDETKQCQPYQKSL
jgi:hypothetical protein